MSDQSQSQGEQAAAGAPQPVPVNMYEADQALVLVAALPGVMPDDITVSLKGTTATIQAGMRSAAPKDYLLHEWHYGPFERTVEIPDGFSGGAEASFGNGQLAVRLLRGEGGPEGDLVITPEK